MPVDVLTEITIDRPRAMVAEFAASPDNALTWYENIHSVHWDSDAGLAVGSEIVFNAWFLVKRLRYTYTVLELIEGERMVMATDQGKFPMETTYEWFDAAAGGTRMTLRNRGEPKGWPGVAAPLMARSMRKANLKDLARLKDVLERITPPS
jgi:polyketide cyclase/dehydrase/lipid transport protein